MRYLRKILASIAVACSILVVLSQGSCTSQLDQGEFAGAAPFPSIPGGTSPKGLKTRQELEKALAEVREAIPPPDVAPELFEDLKRALAQVLMDRLQEDATGKHTSDTPFGYGNQVNDLLVGVGGSNRASWTYRNRGDYDLNGETNVSDLTSIGVHFGKTSASPLWLLASRADGDGNGEVNLADITPIGLNYGSKVVGYRMWATDNLAGDWQLVGDIPFASLIRNTEQPRFVHMLPSVDYTYYNLWTYDNSEYEGGLSNTAIAGTAGTRDLEGFYEVLY